MAILIYSHVILIDLLIVFRFINMFCSKYRLCVGGGWGVYAYVSAFARVVFVALRVYDVRARVCVYVLTSVHLA